MPGQKDEQEWKEAKKIVREQRDKSEDDFTDRDWGLVQHIYNNKVESSKTKLSAMKLGDTYVFGEEDWLEKKVKNPKTGREVKVKSLDPEERKKYKPKEEKTKFEEDEPQMKANPDIDDLEEGSDVVIDLSDPSVGISEQHKGKVKQMDDDSEHVKVEWEDGTSEWISYDDAEEKFDYAGKL